MSRPASQTDKDESAIGGPGRHSPGKQLGQVLASNTRKRRAQIDIVFEKVETHVDAEIKHCPQCRT